MNNNGSKYNRLREYERYLRLNFPSVKTIGVNRFYVYDYIFFLSYPYSELKYYDWKVLGYCFRQTKSHIWCLNFHHIPVTQRWHWMENVRKLSKKLQEDLPFINFDDARLTRIPGLNYPLVWKVLKKSKIAIRCYRKEAILNLRQVYLKDFSEVSRYCAKTYFDVGIKAIDARYASYHP
jgi:hypothetical protein